VARGLVLVEERDHEGVAAFHREGRAGRKRFEYGLGVGVRSARRSALARSGEGAGVAGGIEA
jgi:hypothetical protein